MGRKNISLSEEAYGRLAALKGPSESFSDVVLRLTCKWAIVGLAGVRSHDEADAVRGAIKEMRAGEFRDRIDEIRSGTGSLRNVTDEVAEGHEEES